MEKEELKETLKLNEMAQVLDRGIDDMEAGRELPVDDAFQLVADLVEKRRRARA